MLRFGEKALAERWKSKVPTRIRHLILCGWMRLRWAEGGQGEGKTREDLPIGSAQQAGRGKGRLSIKMLEEELGGAEREISMMGDIQYDMTQHGTN